MDPVKKPELLAPAGSMECFHAAIDSGADAVYLGLVDFNARLRARNFTTRTLAYLVPYAHTRKRKIYVTLNTLIKHSELERAIHLLYQLDQLKVDGLIVQDLGIIEISRKNFPGLRLHASTQMAVHNSLGVAAAQRLGIKRAVLARELTLQEIASVRKNTSLELEVFVHGALCYCFSGMCLASSFLGGSSGNRGRCTQVCRRPFTTGGGTGHFFSPGDFCALQFLGKFRDIGITSLKIEGRMKSADYVATVVGLYRKALDHPDLVPGLLKEVDGDLGRKKTTLFLGGIKQDGVIDPTGPTGTGLFLGKITRCDAAGITIDGGKLVEEGDLIRIQPHSGFEGNNVRVAGVLLHDGLRTFRLKDQISFGKGDLVYLTRLAPRPGRGKKTRIIPQKALPFKQFYQDAQALLQQYKVSQSGANTHAKRRLFVKIDDPAWLPLLESVDIDTLIISLEKEAFEGFFANPQWVDMWAQKTVMGFPPFIAEGETGEWKTILKSARENGVFRAMCQNLGQLQLTGASMKTYSDSMVWCFNGAARKALFDLGISGFAYSLEDEYPNMSNVASARGMAYLFAHVPLFVSRIRPGLAANAKIIDSFGNEFFTVEKHGLFYLVAQEPYNLFHKRTKLEEARIKTFIIDLSFCAPDKKLYLDLIAGYNEETRVPGSSMFNCKAGIK